METWQQKVERLVDFTRIEVAAFLAAHAEETFYAFAFDCNTTYGEIGLCFNTEEAFAVCLADYQSDSYRERYGVGDYYHTAEGIRDLKLNTGNWEYQCVASENISTEDIEYEEQEALQNRLLFQEVLQVFMQTEVYHQIPKTAGFLAFCIDHDEEIDDALLRLAP